jgi:hypothetical protein
MTLPAALADHSHVAWLPVAAVEAQRLGERYDTKLWMRDLKEGAAYLPKRSTGRKPMRDRHVGRGAGERVGSQQVDARLQAKRP